MDALQHYALAAGLAWASGIRLYAAVFLTGGLGRYGYVNLPDGLLLLTDPWVIGVSGVLMVGEFIADKVPAFDSIWDILQTFVRIPAGMLLAWGVFRDSGASMQFAAALIGGTITTGTHLTKAGSRAVINTSPEPFTNWGTSLAEDVSLLGAVWLIWKHPLIFLALLGLFFGLVAWLLPKVLRGLCALWRRLRGLPLQSA